MENNVLNETKSVAKEVRDFIARRPFIVDSIRQNVVNYTALARVIKNEIRVGSIEAIKVAIIREKDTITKNRGLQEEKILSLLKKTKVNLQDKISVIISKKELDIPHIVVATLENEFVYVIDQTQKYESLTDVEEGSVMIEKDLVALILKSPKEIENTPGVVAFISQLLASKNINIKQFLSCYTDTIIILELKDALTAFSLLQRYI
jgi:aspartokinase